MLQMIGGQNFGCKFVPNFQIGELPNFPLFSILGDLTLIERVT